MNTTTIHIKTDTKTRDEAEKVAQDKGFTLPSLLNTLLKQIARTKSLDIDLDETPNAYMIEQLKKSEDDVKAGRVISFKSGKEAVNYVRSLIVFDKQIILKILTPNQ